MVDAAGDIDAEETVTGVAATGGVGTWVVAGVAEAGVDVEAGVEAGAEAVAVAFFFFDSFFFSSLTFFLVGVALGSGATSSSTSISSFGFCMARAGDL